MPYALPAPHLLALLLGVSMLGACSGENSDTLLGDAKAKLAAGDHKAAMIQLKNAVTADARNAEARFELGKLHFDQLEYASAEKEFRRAREAGYAADLANVMIARALLAQREFQRLLDELPVRPSTGPHATTLRALRAAAELALGRKEEARAALQAALDAAPDSPDVHFTLAQVALSDRQPDLALQSLDAALRADPQHRDSLLLKADLLHATGKSEDARALYREIVRLYPRHANAHLALAGIDIAANRLPAARAEVALATKIAPNSLHARYLEALIDFRENKTDQAKDRLASVLKNAPNYLPALQLGGSIEFALGNFRTAEAYLNKVVKAAPGNPYTLRILAASQLRLGRPDDAERTLAPALRNAQQDAGVLTVAGEIASAQNDPAKAAAYFEAAARQAPESALIRTELGISRLAQGDARALADLQAAAEMKGSGSRADTVVIQFQLKQKQFDAALASIARLEKKQGVSATVWNYRGAAFLGKRDVPRARESFGEALKLDPAFFPAAANLAQLDVQEKRPADARARFEAVLQADPDHLNAMLALAGLSLREQDDKAYAGWLEKAAAAHPDAVPPRVALARHLLARGDKAKALAVAREAVNAHPDNPEALDLLGAVQLALGDTANALGAYRKLAERAPSDSAPLLKIAGTQLAAKDLAGARKTLQDALRLHPDLLDAQLLLGGVEIQSARYDEAQRLARQIQQQKPTHAAGFSLEGDVATARGHHAAALAAFERAHQLAPSGALLVRQLQVLQAMQRADAGEKRLAAWLVAHPDDARARLALAESLITRKQYAPAVEHYLTLNRASPNNLVVLNNLAWALAERKDPRALAYSEQALKLQPDRADVLDTYGWLQVKLGDAAKGLAALKKAQSKAPDDAEIQWHLAYALNVSGNPARARQELKLLLDRRIGFQGDIEARALYQQLNAAL